MTFAIGSNPTAGIDVAKYSEMRTMWRAVRLSSVRLVDNLLVATPQRFHEKSCGWRFVPPAG